MKFTGYFKGWNRCECGQTLLLNKKQGVLKHRSGGVAKHGLVLTKRAEATARIAN